jgi:dTDP-4-dehydrorhamnose 3,5-epimerase
MNRFEVRSTAIDGVVVLQRQAVGDSRGYLQRLYCQADLRAVVGERRVEQVNYSFTAERGTVRGLHFQTPPFAEMKIIGCLRGIVFDVAVDLRPDSPTYLRWHGEVLSEDNLFSLVVPEGCAHGFQSMTDNAALIYHHTASYNKATELGVNAKDPTIGIEWPLPVTHRSNRDVNLPKAIDLGGKLWP